MTPAQDCEERSRYEQFLAEEKQRPTESEQVTVITTTRNRPDRSDGILPWRADLPDVSEQVVRFIMEHEVFAPLRQRIYSTLFDA